MQQRTMIIVTVVLVVIVAFLTLAILAGMYLTGGQTYEVLVAKAKIPANRKIKSAAIAKKEVDEEPSTSVITDRSKIVGKVAAKTIKKGSTFKPGHLRDKFRAVRTVESIPPGNRIQPNLVTTTKVDELAPNAVTDISAVEGKMVRRGLAANTIVTEDDYYQKEQKIVITRDTIPPNTMIRKEQVKVVSRPQAPPDAVSDVKKVVGRPLRRKLNKGDVVRSSDLFPDRNQLSYLIPLYRRAVTIPVSNYNNVSYMLRPGDQVDLYVYIPEGFSRGSINNQQDQIKTDLLKKIADGAEVLALNDVFTQEKINQIESGGKNKKAKKFTYQRMILSLTLWESEKVNLIRAKQESGGGGLKFFVILRPRQLDAQYGDRTVSNYDLFGKNLGEEAARESNGPSVTVIQGDQEESYRVPEHR
ncbi:MAG: Flp pilus assembly protein CpaB [bacterium]